MPKVTELIRNLSHSFTDVVSGHHNPKGVIIIEENEGDPCDNRYESLDSCMDDVVGMKKLMEKGIIKLSQKYHNASWALYLI